MSHNMPPCPPALAQKHLDQVPPAHNIYCGGAFETGHTLIIVVSGEGKDVHLEEDVGPAATIALGLTECCARQGEGKVTITSLELFPYLPESYARLPDLLYVGYVWDHDSQTEWFKMDHVKRMDELDARNGALNPGIPCMPITLFYSEDDYSYFNFCDGVASVIFSYGCMGDMHLGRLSDMKEDEATRCEASTSDLRLGMRSYWECLAWKFDISSGEEVAQQLETWYQAGVPESIWMFRNILVQWSKTFDEWKANGGHHAPHESLLGDELTLEAKRLTAEFYANTCKYPASRPGFELDCREYYIRYYWKDYKRHAWGRMIVAADQGFSALSRFIRSDDEFICLHEDDQTELMRMLELKQESFHRLSDANRAGIKEWDSEDRQFRHKKVPDDPIERNKHLQSKRKRLGKIETEPNSFEGGMDEPDDDLDDDMNDENGTNSNHVAGNGGVTEDGEEMDLS